MKINKEKALRRAAEIVAERGWGRVTVELSATDGPCCILKACANAIMEQGFEFPDDMDGNTEYDIMEELSFVGALSEVGATAGSTCARDVYRWNDRMPGHKSSDIEAGQRTVIEKLLEAADLEASKVASI